MSTATVKTPLPSASGQLAVGARAAAWLFELSLRTWRRFDSSGRIPRGHKLGGRKLWRASDLHLWSEWGFPDRAEFERRLKAESKEGAKNDGQ